MTTRLLRYKRLALTVSAAALGVASFTTAAEAFKTSEDAMMKGVNGWSVDPIFTVGETVPSTDPRYIDGYTPAGIPDGIAVFPRDGYLLVLVNHELDWDEGYPYKLCKDEFCSRSFHVTGARVSYLKLGYDGEVLGITDGGIAYDRVYGRDRKGTLVKRAVAINEIPPGNEWSWLEATRNPSATQTFSTSADRRSAGFSRFCSSQGVQAGTYGFVDDAYFTGEETGDPRFHPHGGTLWALDIHGRKFWAVPAAGRGAWENVTPLDASALNSDGKEYVALLMGDDNSPTDAVSGGSANSDTPADQTIAPPLYLYVGEKNSPHCKIEGDDFMNRNGLCHGVLYVWQSGPGTSPEGFNGTGNSQNGHWVAIEGRSSKNRGKAGYDRFGYLNGYTLRELAKNEKGAFQFSRPEDVATNPLDGTQAIFASTGRGSVFPADNWGTTYLVDVDFTSLTALLSILYDGDDAGDGQFFGPDWGLRSPDNLEWAHDGRGYVNEDSATQNGEFGGDSAREASVWQINPENLLLERVGQIDRSVLAPSGVSDEDSGSLGAWESSGALDVTHLIRNLVQGDAYDDHTILIADVQAHGTTEDSSPGTPIADQGLVEGGQLILLHGPAEISPPNANN